MTLTPSPLLVPWSSKGTAIPLLLPTGRKACTEPQCLYKGALYLFTLLPHTQDSELTGAPASPINNDCTKGATCGTTSNGTARSAKVDHLVKKLNGGTSNTHTNTQKSATAYGF